MTQFYGLIGAQRVGKTTLAKEMATLLEIPFHKTEVAALMAAMGVSNAVDMPFIERLAVQTTILECLMASYAEARSLYPNAPVIVVDRTPMDVLAYTTTEILRSTLANPETNRLMQRHESLAYNYMNFNFMGACLVQPGIRVVEDPLKAPGNLIYQRHVNACMVEAACNVRCQVPVYIMGFNNLELNSRVTDTIEHFSAIINTQTRAEKQAHPKSVGSVH